jgi:hypothetical protein
MFRIIHKHHDEAAAAALFCMPTNSGRKSDAPSSADRSIGFFELKGHLCFFQWNKRNKS